MSDRFEHHKQNVAQAMRARLEAIAEERAELERRKRDGLPFADLSRERSPAAPSDTAPEHQHPGATGSRLRRSRRLA